MTPTPEETRRALYENVALGYMEIVGEDEDGEPLFRLTDAGVRRVEAMLGGKDDAQ